MAGTLKDQITALTDRAFDELIAWAVTEEKARRDAAPAVAEAKREGQAETVAEVAQKLAAADSKLAPPAKADTTARPWKPWHPTDKTTHFYYGDKATNGGKTWRNVVDPARKQPNVWEPGSAGIDERYWVEEKAAEPTPAPAETTPAETTPAAAPAWKAGTTYKPGDKVTYQGATYEVIQTNTAQAGWEPPAVPALFKKV